MKEYTSPEQGSTQVPEYRGFEGLLALVTDIRQELALAESAKCEAPSVVALAQTAGQPATGNGPTVGGIVILGVAAVLIVIAIAVFSQSRKPTDSSAPVGTGNGASSNLPVSGGGVDSLSGSGDGSVGSAPRASEAPISPSRESVPPIGTAVLSLEQLRWCKYESIRIEAWRPAAETEAQVTLFNASVDEYNSRCKQFSYRPRDMETVDREILFNRSALETEGRSRASR